MKYFQLSINVINGEVKEFPKTFNFSCSDVTPIGNTIIRYFTDDMCQVAHRTFYIMYKGELFGTNQFSTVEQFWNYTNCYPAIVYALSDGCEFRINGQMALIS